MALDDQPDRQSLHELLSPGLLDGQDGPAPRLPSGALEQQLQSILARAHSGPGVAGSVEPLPSGRVAESAYIAPEVVLQPPAGRGWRRTTARAAMLWVAGTLVAGSAAAWFVGKTQLWEQWAGAPETTPVVSVSHGKGPAADRAPARLPEEPSAEPEASAPTAVLAAPAESATAPARVGAAAGSVAQPGDLLARASRLRGDGRYRAAQHAYLQALAADPNGPVGQVSAVAAAAIRLEHLGNPRGAIKLYRRALAAGVDEHVAQEAYAGLARAHRELRQLRAELRALDSLIALEIPGPARVRALERRGELQAVFHGREATSQ